MSFLGNVIWMIFGGLINAAVWFLAGCLWCITLIEIPIGMQCFKFARLGLAPFGKEVVYVGSSVSLLLNIIWLIVSGLPLAIAHLISALLLTLTIVGIPFAQQSLKMAKLALMPFGARIVSRR